MEKVGLEYRETSDGDLVVTGRGALWGGEIVIPDKVSGRVVVGIDDGAFKKDKGVRSVVVPEGVAYIGEEAFTDCSSLETSFLPSTLLEIGARAFADTDSEGERGLKIKEVHIADVSSWCRVRFLGDDSNPLLGGGGPIHRRLSRDGTLHPARRPVCVGKGLHGVQLHRGRVRARFGGKDHGTCLRSVFGA